MSDQKGQTYYDVLEITRTASAEEIHRAFLKAKTTYSPSSPALYSVFTEEEAAELLKLVDEAYAVLGHSERRKAYDERLDGGPVTQDDPPSRPKENTAVKRDNSVVIQSEHETDDVFEEEIKNQEIFDGTFLQRVRNYRNVTLEEMAKVTRVGRNYLIAIENNEFSALPAPVFIRGFVVQYSKSLGLDYRKVSESYMKIFFASQNK